MRAYQLLITVQVEQAGKASVSWEEVASVVQRLEPSFHVQQSLSEQRVGTDARAQHAIIQEIGSLRERAEERKGADLFLADEACSSVSRRKPEQGARCFGK